MMSAEARESLNILYIDAAHVGKSHDNRTGYVYDWRLLRIDYVMSAFCSPTTMAK